jgi:hypothetical protein
VIVILQRWFEDLLLPELCRIAPHQRESALKRAGEEPIEFVEWAGMLLGLVLTVSMTRYATSDLEVSARLALAAANLLVAVPLLTVLVGPFLVRRKRRGLRAFMREKSRAASAR